MQLVRNRDSIGVVEKANKKQMATPKTEQLQIRIYDRDAEEGTVITGEQIEYLEWDGYPSRDYTKADWFLVEVVGDDFTYMVDREDLDEQADLALLSYAEGIVSGSIYQKGAEQFQDTIQVA